MYVYITEPEPISTAYFIKPFYHSVCLYDYPFTFPRQRLGKKRYCGNEYTLNNRRIVRRIVLYAVRVVLKESRRYVFFSITSFFSTTNFGQSERNGDRQMDGRLTIIYMDEITEKKRSSDKNYGPGVVIMYSIYRRPTKNIFIIYLSFVAKKQYT
jgi:hypothetical protein